MFNYLKKVFRRRRYRKLTTTLKQIEDGKDALPLLLEWLDLSNEFYVSPNDRWLAIDTYFIDSYEMVEGLGTLVRHLQYGHSSDFKAELQTLLLEDWLINSKVEQITLATLKEQIEPLLRSIYKSISNMARYEGQYYYELLNPFILTLQGIVKHSVVD